MAVSDIDFVLPAGSEQASGGNVYNAELVRALGALAGAAGSGVPCVRTLEPADFTRRIAAGVPGTYCVDTLNFREALVLADKTAEQRAVLVVHHLPSLEPGILPEDRALGLERDALPLFDAYLATSPFTAELLVRRGIARERIMTVEPGLPAVTLEPLVPEPPFRALLVGNLIRRKGVLELLHALGTTASAEDPFEIDVVGRADLDPDYAVNIGRLITTMPALTGRVHWHAPVPYAEMGDYYRHAHVFVSAASMETYGMALAEARAHGLPIFALDGGHTRFHFTDGEDGQLFDSVRALAAGFLTLVREPNALASLFERARRTATPGDGTWERAARRFVSELARVFG
jgi:glycosyltransferase involved in cell wall biosynthesis